MINPEASSLDSTKQIVVPIYNEGKNVQILYDSLAKTGFEFDLLKFVYDIPEDTSLPYIEQMRAQDSRVVAEQNKFGKGVINALKWGFSQSSSGPVLVLMGDNSDKLSILSEMVKLWESGNTIVSPSRYMRGGIQHGGPPIKSFLSKIQGKFIYLLGFPTSDPTNNFKLYDGEWLKSQTIESSGGFEVALELCYKAYLQNKRIAELPTEWWDRTEGESRFKLMKWLPLYLGWYFKILKVLTLGRS